MKRRSTITLALFVLVASATPLAAVAQGDQYEGRRRNVGSLNEDYELRRAQWEERYRQALVAERDAQKRLFDAKQARRKADRRLRLQGERRVQLEEAIDLEQTALQEAQTALAALHEEARLAAVPPGWLRNVEDELAVPASADD